jgi:hypothetical protein
MALRNILTLRGRAAAVSKGARALIQVPSSVTSRGGPPPDDRVQNELWEMIRLSRGDDNVLKTTRSFLVGL